MMEILFILALVFSRPGEVVMGGPKPYYVVVGSQQLAALKLAEEKESRKDNPFAQRVSGKLYRIDIQNLTITEIPIPGVIIEDIIRERMRR